MKQSRMQSLMETLANTSIGMMGSWLITMAMLMIFTTPVGIATSTTILCTIWSVGRGYCLRRYFDSKHSQETVVN